MMKVDNDVLNNAFEAGLKRRFGTSDAHELNESERHLFDALIRIKSDGNLLAATEVHSWSESKRDAFDSKYGFTSDAHSPLYIYQWGFLRGIVREYMNQVKINS